MSKQNFYRLLKRYRSGECTDREKNLVEQWFSTLDEGAPHKAEQEYDHLEEKLWMAIQEKKRGPKISEARPLIKWKWAAAAVLILAVAGWGLYRADQVSLPVAGGQVTYSGATSMLKKISGAGTTEKVILSDGTEISLLPHSSLEYPAHFDGESREVKLIGKAFFKVAPNPEKPFLVHTGEIVTRVLGTSFWVDGSSPQETIEVSVVSGKVAVSKRENPVLLPESGPVKGGVILTANQKVKFSHESELFETGLVEQPVPVTTEHLTASGDLFVFEGTPISEVIAKLERAYGIEIILANEDLRGCLFRGDITQQPLFTKLDLLCSSVNASYEIRGTRVLVSGKGC